MISYAGEDVEKGEHFSTAGGSANSYSQSVCQLIKKMGISLPQDPAIPFLGIYPKGVHSYNMDICSTMFIASLFVIASS